MMIMGERGTEYVWFMVWKSQMYLLLVMWCSIRWVWIRMRVYDWFHVFLRILTMDYDGFACMGERGTKYADFGIWKGLYVFNISFVR